jgi:hypothetical protein
MQTGDEVVAGVVGDGVIVDSNRLNILDTIDGICRVLVVERQGVVVEAGPEFSHFSTYMGHDGVPFRRDLIATKGYLLMIAVIPKAIIARL